VRHKNTPKFIDHKLKVDYQILIIFGTNTPDTTSHQTIIQIFASSNMCFCTTWGNPNTWNRRWNEKSQKHPRRYRL